MLAISNQPPIKMTASDVEGLWSLAETSLRGHPELTEFLVGEIARAKLVDADVAHDLVTMNSWVEFRYGLTNQRSGRRSLSILRRQTFWREKFR